MPRSEAPSEEGARRIFNEAREQEWVGSKSALVALHKLICHTFCHKPVTSLSQACHKPRSLRSLTHLPVMVFCPCGFAPPRGEVADLGLDLGLGAGLGLADPPPESAILSKQDLFLPIVVLRIERRSKRGAKSN